MQTRSRSWIVALLAVIALVAVTVWWTQRDTSQHASDTRSSDTDEAADARIADEITTPRLEAPDAWRAREPEPVAAPVAPPTTVDAPTAAPALDLHSAEATVETAATLLREGRDDDFIATFLPAVRERLTPRAIERCRARVVTSNTPLRPDWEMAEESTEDGHRVRRVSLYGHETTGFHEIDGRWLADRAWCVPTDVPDDA